MIKQLFKHWTLQVFQPRALIKDKYLSFQSLLENDKRAHELMAELEEIYYDQIPMDFTVIEEKYAQFYNAVGEMIADLLRICPGKFSVLTTIHKKFDHYVRFLLASGAVCVDPPYTLTLDDQQAMDASLAGGKAANLSAASQLLKLTIPPGFVVSRRTSMAPVVHPVIFHIAGKACILAPTPP